MNDFRYALRTLRRSPGLVAVAVSSLALGIGANTAIFSLTNAVILRSLPVQKPAELALLRYVSKKGNVFSAFSYPDYVALRDTGNVLSGLAAVASADVNLASEEATERVAAELVTGNYFDLLGIRPALGRLLQPNDDRDAGGHPVCVISSGLWQRRFGSARDIVGRSLQLNGRAYTVLGVAPENFEGLRQGSHVQVYVPLMMAAEVLSRPSNAKLQPPFLEWEDWLELVARRKPGVTAERAQAVLDARFEQLPLAHRETTFEMSSRHGAPGDRARLLVADGRQGDDNLRLQYEQPLLFLLFLVGLLLLIACANVASLLVARAAGQRKQVAIRLALGAGRWALIRQQLAESAVLAAAGAALGFVLSLWISKVLVTLAAGASSQPIDARPDWQVVGYLLGIAGLAALLFGLLPALESGRAGLEPALRSDSSGAGRRRGLLSASLVVIQVALSVTLLAGSGLLLRSLYNLRSISTGFQPDNIVIASLNSGANRYPVARARALLEDLLQRAETIPGVRSASAASISPLSGSMRMSSVDVPGYKPPPGQFNMIYQNAVGPAFFTTIGLPVVSGREFTRRDRDGSPRVVVVNEQMARKFWPGRDPVGQRFRSGNADIEVVGVVRDAVYRDLREAPPATFYLPLLQGDARSVTLHLRVAGNPAPVFRELAARAQAVDRAVPLFGMQTMEAQIAGRLSPERMLATVSTILGALAIGLAMVGLYSVLAHAVAQRAREIGIRMALGARQNQVIGMILRETAVVLAIGLAIGIPGALAASRWIRSLLYGVKPQDPATYVVIALLVCLAAFAAAVAPSRRASQVDPMVVLRYE